MKPQQRIPRRTAAILAFPANHATMGIFRRVLLSHSRPVSTLLAVLAVLAQIWSGAAAFSMPVAPMAVCAAMGDADTGGPAHRSDHTHGCTLCPCFGGKAQATVLRPESPGSGAAGRSEAGATPRDTVGRLRAAGGSGGPAPGASAELLTAIAVRMHGRSLLVQGAHHAFLLPNTGGRRRRCRRVNGDGANFRPPASHPQRRLPHRPTHPGSRTPGRGAPPPASPPAPPT